MSELYEVIENSGSAGLTENEIKKMIKQTMFVTKNALKHLSKHHSIYKSKLDQHWRLKKYRNMEGT